MALSLHSLGKALNGSVLVTGHTGFKGTWLTLLLEALGIEVQGYSLNPEPNSLYSRLNRQGKIHEEFADIRNKDKLISFINLNSPVAVIHLAAQPLVLESYKNPLETFETNVIGTANLLDAVTRASRVKVVVAITTDKVYDNQNEGKAFTETFALRGKDPYSASKVAAEAAIAAWQQINRNNSNLKIVAARAGNVIGGGDWADNRLLPDIIRGFFNEELVEIRNPRSTRPWQHVIDPLIGYLLTLRKILDGSPIDAINFGPLGASLSVKEVVELAQKTWASPVKVKYGETNNRDYEATNLELNSQFAQHHLNWRPMWTQEDAIISTVEWWKRDLLEGRLPNENCAIDIQYALAKI